MDRAERERIAWLHALEAEAMETGDIEAARAGAEAILAVEAAAEEAARRQREAATDWRSGVRRGLAEYAREAAQAADQAEAALTGAFRGMKDALVAFVQTGKLSFASLVDAILAGLARMAIRQAILAPFLNALGLGLSPPALTGTVPPAPVSPNLGVFHRGGLVGVPGCITRTGLPPPRRSAPPAALSPTGRDS